MATINIYVVSITPIPAVPLTATLFYRVFGSPSPYTIYGDISILPSGNLAVPVAITGLFADTTYQIKVKLLCGTVYLLNVHTPAGCPPSEISNITVDIINDRVIIYFTPYIFPNSYMVEIYRNNIPSLGGLYVGTFTTDTYPLVINDPLVLIKNAVYYVRIITKCAEGPSAWSDFVQYTPTYIIPVALQQQTFGQKIQQIRINTNVATTVDVVYQVQYFDGTMMGPFNITVPATTTTSGWQTFGVGPTYGTNRDITIINATPNPAGAYSIQY